MKVCIKSMNSSVIDDRGPGTSRDPNNGSGPLVGADELENNKPNEQALLEVELSSIVASLVIAEGRLGSLRRAKDVFASLGAVEPCWEFLQ